MLDLTLFLKTPEDAYEGLDRQFGQLVHAGPSDVDDIQNDSIAIMFIPEYRGHNKGQPENTAIPFRSALGKLFSAYHWSKKIYDLGDLLPGKTQEDTHFALQQVVSALLKKNTIPIIVGGSQDLTYPLAIAYESMEQLFNTCCIDSKLDLGKPDESLHSDAYVSGLLLRRPCYLFNHATIGVQPNLNDPQDLDLFDKLFFDVCKLGEFNADFRRAEPILRNSDILSLDLDALKNSERMWPNGNPNGFTIEQMCQITKYAGLSDKLTSIGIFNAKGEAPMDAALIAQLIWYFIDGVALRKGDFPIGNKNDYLRFTVVLEDTDHQIVFYKSNKSERWWMEVPYPPSEFNKYERHHMVPCDHIDYENAMKNEMPDLWWKTYQKLG